MSSPRQVVAVVVTFENEETIRGSLRSLTRRDETRTAARVVVVDSASSDATVEVARASASPSLPVVVIEMDQNLGFAPAVNVGLAEVGDADAVLLLNPDAELDAGALDVMLDVLLSDDGLGAVGPRIVNADGSDELSALRSDIGLWNLFCELSGLRRLSGRWFGSYRCERRDRGEPTDAQCLSGACLVLRAGVLRSLGGLDASLPMYFEDMDLCRRLRDGGWRLRYEAGARLTHEGAHSSASSPARRALKVMEEGDARWLFLRRHRGPTAAGLASVIIGVGSVWRLLLLWLDAVVERGEAAGARRAGAMQKYRDLLAWSTTRPKPVHAEMPR